MSEDGTNEHREPAGAVPGPEPTTPRKRNSGRPFEDDVYEWISTIPRYTEVFHEMRIRPKNAMNPYRVDFVCVEHPSHLTTCNKHGGYVVGVVGALLFPIVLLVTKSFGPSAGTMSGAILLGCFFLLGTVKVIVDAKCGRVTWIECRDRASKVPRKYVQEVERRRDDAAWRPHQVLIVSANGFEEDALLLARVYKIQCWERVNQTFVRLD